MTWCLTEGTQMIELSWDLLHLAHFRNQPYHGDRSFRLRVLSLTSLSPTSYVDPLRSETSGAHVYALSSQPWYKEVRYACVYLVLSATDQAISSSYGTDPTRTRNNFKSLRTGCWRNDSCHNLVPQTFQTFLEVLIYQESTVNDSGSKRDYFCRWITINCASFLPWWRDTGTHCALLLLLCPFHGMRRRSSRDHHWLAHQEGFAKTTKIYQDHCFHRFVQYHFTTILNFLTNSLIYSYNNRAKR